MRGSCRREGGRSRAVSRAERLTTAAPTPLVVTVPAGPAPTDVGAGDSGALTTIVAPDEAGAAAPASGAAEAHGATAPAGSPACSPASSAEGGSPTITSSTTTVALSLPPASLAMRTRVSAASRGSRVRERTAVISFDGHLVGEPVGTEKEAVTFLGDELPYVDVDVGLHPERPGEDVAVRVHRRLLLGQLTARHELLGHGMVGGELYQRVSVQAVGTGVPHVGEHQAVALVGCHQGGRDHRGAHAPQIDVGMAAFPYRLVGVVDGTGQPLGRGLARRTRPAGCRWPCAPRSHRRRARPSRPPRRTG